MSAVLAGVWAFLNSQAGQAAVLFLVGWVFNRTVKSKDRRQQILGIAQRVFQAVEVLGLQKGLKDKEKWLLYVRMIVDQMKAEGLGELSGKEMAMLKALAEQKALANKAPKDGAYR